MPIMQCRLEGCDYQTDDVTLLSQKLSWLSYQFPLALGVLTCCQRHNLMIKVFYARIKGKAATCSSPTCTQSVDFTTTIVNDVLISRLSDDEIKRQVLGWHDLN